MRRRALLCLLAAPGLAQIGPQAHPTKVGKPAANADAPSRPRPRSWIDYALSRFNPSGTDYGRIVEERRRALLDASVRDLRFWYALSTTAGALALAAVCLKQRIDQDRLIWRCAEHLAYALNHDQRSRRAAREAIARYNSHIERCNRLVEDGAQGHATPTAAEAEDWRATVQRITAERDDRAGEVARLKEQLQRKDAAQADLEARLSALERSEPVGGQGDEGALGTSERAGYERQIELLRQQALRAQQAADAEQKRNLSLLDSLNRCRGELETERGRNHALKGG